MRTLSQTRHASLFLIAAALFALALPARATPIDRKIEDSARSSYNFKTWLKNDTITVRAHKGVVWLTGTVSEEQHKVLAEQTVRELPGTRRVENQLTVAGEQPSDHSDEWLTLKVKAALVFHKNVSAVDTEVHTQGGVVTLSGTAGSEMQKRLTGVYAMDVEGVNEVNNALVITAPGKGALERAGEVVDDASITAQIKTTLLFHKSTHALATRVVTRDGTVTLKGKARTAAERDLVTRLSEDIAGVKQVHNRMSVRGA